MKFSREGGIATGFLATALALIFTQLFGNRLSIHIDLGTNVKETKTRKTTNVDETNAAPLLSLSNIIANNEDGNAKFQNKSISWAYDPSSKYVLIDCRGLGSLDMQKMATTSSSSVEHDVYIFYIKDVFSLGHMQQHFVQFFAWLTSLSKLPPKRRPPVVYVTYGKHDPSTLRNIKYEYYEPMRRDFMRYFRERYEVDVRFVPEQLPKQLESCRSLPTAVLSTLHTPTPNRIVTFEARCFGKVWVDYIGGCPAWFPNPNTVREWRRYLQDIKISRYITAVQNEQTYGDQSEQQTPSLFQVLVFDRDKGYKRSLVDPQEVVSITQSACPQCNVTYYEFRGRREGARSWHWNCQFFASYDFILLTHGAACSNILCMKEGAGLLEFVPDQRKGSVSLYAPVADQILLRRHSVLFAEGKDNFEAPIQPDATALKVAVRKVYDELVKEASANS